MAIPSVVFRTKIRICPLPGIPYLCEIFSDEKDHFLPFASVCLLDSVFQPGKVGLHPLLFTNNCYRKDQAE
jgi:hypothetical protein